MHFSRISNCSLRYVICQHGYLDVMFVSTDAGALLTFGWGLYGQVSVSATFSMCKHIIIIVAPGFLNYMLKSMKLSFMSIKSQI